VEAAAKEAPNMPPQRNGHSEDIQAFTVLGAIVDDDNLPAPKNIPPPNGPPIQPGASNDYSLQMDGASKVPALKNQTNLLTVDRASANLVRFGRQ
jgi:hypothetical protein